MITSCCVLYFTVWPQAQNEYTKGKKTGIAILKFQIFAFGTSIIFQESSSTKKRNSFKVVDLDFKIDLFDIEDSN